MKTFKDLILEIERRELDVIWDKSGLVGKFDNDGNIFEVEFTKISKGDYIVKFFRLDGGKRSIEMFNDNRKVGNVITTMKAVLRSFVKRKNPVTLSFLARVSDKGRVRLYDKIGDLLGIKFKYNAYSEVFDSHKVYVLHRYTEDKFNEIKMGLVKRVYNRIM